MQEKQLRSGRGYESCGGQSGAGSRDLLHYQNSEVVLPLILIWEGS